MLSIDKCPQASLGFQVMLVVKYPPANASDVRDSGSIPSSFPVKNTGVDNHFLLQGIFPTQGSNPGLLHCRWFLAWQADSLQTDSPGKPFLSHDRAELRSLSF